MAWLRPTSSLRLKLVLAFAAVLLLVSGLTAYAIMALADSHALVHRIYDEPLIGVNQARAAYAQFAKARAAMDVALALSDNAPKDGLQQIDARLDEIAKDLAVVGKRVRLNSVDTALNEAEAHIQEWYQTGRKLIHPPPDGLTEVPFPGVVENKADTAAAAIDRVVELTAAYGLEMRATSMAQLEQARTYMIALALATGVVGLVMSMGFAVSISQPVKAATAVAERVAKGDFSDEITSSRRDELGRLLQALAQMQISLRQAAEANQEEIRLQNERFHAAINNMPAGLCMFDSEQRLVVCNKAYAEMYAIPPELLAPGTRLRKIVEHRIANGIYSGENPQDYIEERMAWVSRGEPGSKTQHLSDGRTITIAHQPIGDGGWVTTHADITELTQVQEQIVYMAHHDALTDLPNRQLLRERLDEAMPLAQRGHGFAVMCLDLDRFKSVNDTLGHPVGDKLLKAVADRLGDCTREQDMIARLGGDEFAIVQMSENQPEDATTLAARICELIARPFELDDHQVVVGTSVGIAIAPDDGDHPDKLIKNADMALYRAKTDGRGVYRFFEPEMDARMQARRRLELDLRKAMEKGEFELYYQPLVTLETNAISGFEALLRWNHPERGLVLPGEFIPLAEEVGLIVPIGEWVIRRACVEAATWSPDLKVAVNLSPAQFRNDNLVPAVFHALARAGIAANRLELEITEAVLMQDNEATLKTLHQLRDMGVRIAMDDFGTGYSSLSYLRSFPFDKIKIDGSFVHEPSETEGHDAIVNAVADLSRSLGIATTAEGVETQEQLQMVRMAGYSEGQGYFFSKPCKAEEIAETFFPTRKQTAVGA